MAGHSAPLLKIMESIDKVMQDVYDDLDLSEEELEPIDAAYQAIEEKISELADAIDDVDKE